MGVTNYSYSALVEKGEQIIKTGVQTNAIAGVRAWFSSPYNAHTGDIPIEREGVVVWVPLKTATTQERERWEAMILGVREVHRLATAYAIKSDNKEARFRFQIPADKQVLLPIKTKINMAAEMGGAGHTYEQAAETWNIPRQLNVASWAALFYILYARHLREDQQATQELQFLIDRLAPLFANYIDMVVGGEARHMPRFSGGIYTKGAAPKDVEAEALTSPHISLDPKTGALALLGAKHDKIGLTSDRTQCWIQWRTLRKELGIDALNWCIMSHLTSQSHSYGGPLWANAANLVRLREKGEKSDVFFIDQAFSLQHNGGDIFNKLWNVNSLGQVLDLAFKGETAKLPKFLTDREHLDIYRRVCVQLTQYDTTGAQKGALVRNERKMGDFKESTVLKLREDAKVESIPTRQVGL